MGEKTWRIERHRSDMGLWERQEKKRKRWKRWEGDEDKEEKEKIEWQKRENFEIRNDRKEKWVK